MVGAAPAAPHLLLFLCALQGTRPPSSARFSAGLYKQCSGERPRGGVQSGGQQGVPLPDKNRFFPVPARHKSHTLPPWPFKINLAQDSTPETFYFVLPGPGPHLSNQFCPASHSVSFLLLAVDSSALPKLPSGHLLLRN